MLAVDRGSRGGIDTQVTEWAATIDRRYHDAVIFDLDCMGRRDRAGRRSRFLIRPSRCCGGREMSASQQPSTPAAQWPETLGAIEFPLVYRGQRLHLRVIGRTATVTAEAGNAGPVDVECRGCVQRLLPGRTIEVGQMHWSVTIAAKWGAERPCCKAANPQ